MVREKSKQNGKQAAECAGRRTRRRIDGDGLVKHLLDLFTSMQSLPLPSPSEPHARRERIKPQSASYSLGKSKRRELAAAGKILPILPLINTTVISLSFASCFLAFSSFSFMTD